LAYVLFDADLRVADWNAAAERTFGYARDEVLGMGPPFEKILPPDGWPAGCEVIRRLRGGDMAAHAVNENRTKDGRTIIVLNTARLLNSKETLALEAAVREPAKA
jgi:PAS domain S-box-containing protein